MKTRIIVGAGLLLTLSTAVAGTLMFGNSVAQTEAVAIPSNVTAETPMTPEMLAMWSSQPDRDNDYIAPKVPI
ncbi:MAG TPA: hypothetical protein VL494_10270 [Steroidobacteraceae bacterium]|jgi:hypothetical protein|nr:hypothetical protein [Steroidobacteraceae bacterium]